MNLNLLFLPLLGGFIFVRNWRPTRYYALRSEGHVLIFYATAAGTCFCLIAAFIVFYAGPQQPDLDEYWHQVVPFEHSGKAVLAFALGALSWLPLNVFFDDTKQAHRAVNRRRNPLEVLFINAMETSQLVAVSLKNKKVYVGYVVATSNPAFPLESIAICPMMSGYRNDNDQTVTFTTPYIEAYDRIKAEADERVRKEASVDSSLSEKEIQEWIEEETHDAVNAFRHVIMVREIDTAFIFKLDIYQRYFGSRTTPRAAQDSD